MTHFHAVLFQFSHRMAYAGLVKGQIHVLKIAIMVPRKRLSMAIAATFWPRGRRALRARRPQGPNVKNVVHTRMHCQSPPVCVVTIPWTTICILRIYIQRATVYSVRQIEIGLLNQSINIVRTILSQNFDPWWQPDGFCRQNQISVPNWNNMIKL